MPWAVLGQCPGHAMGCIGANNRIIGQTSKSIRKSSLFQTLDDLLFLDI